MALIAWGWRKIDLAFLTYLVAAMVFIHSKEPHMSTARYELVLFPVFLLIGRLMTGRPKLAWTLASLCIAAQIFYFYPVRHVALGGLGALREALAACEMRQNKTWSN